MAVSGLEPVGSMGDDTPIAVLSRRPRLLFDYFKQLFAQVTNPPIDSIREKVVMSLRTTLGARLSWLEETPEHARQIRIASPYLADHELMALLQIPDPAFAAVRIACHFDPGEGVDALEAAVERLSAEAEAAVDAGGTLLVLTDRGVDGRNVPIPMLLAVGAVHHHLIRAGKRLRCSLVCESGECRDVHHFACLIGFGASAVNPYVAIDSLREAVEAGRYGELTLDKALANFRKAVESGLLKVMAKMGISTIASYHGAQIRGNRSRAGRGGPVLLRHHQPDRRDHVPRDCRRCGAAAPAGVRRSGGGGVGCRRKLPGGEGGGVNITPTTPRWSARCTGS